MHKVCVAMKSNESQSFTGKTIIDEFVYRERENLKQGRSADSKKKKIVAAVVINDLSRFFEFEYRNRETNYF